MYKSSDIIPNVIGNNINRFNVYSEYTMYNSTGTPDRYIQ